MKRGLSLALAAVLLAVTGRAGAVETGHDVESDHLVAGEGALRAIALLVHPVSVATGWIGAEVDAAVGGRWMLSLAGEGRWDTRVHADRVSLGGALFLSRSFEGFYVHRRSGGPEGLRTMSPVSRSAPGSRSDTRGSGRPGSPFDSEVAWPTRSRSSTTARVPSCWRGSVR
jgi:hypothetical protein